MKLVVLVLLFVHWPGCLAWGRYTPWAPGREYVYGFTADSYITVKELGPQLVGLQIHAQLIVTVLDVNTLVVRLSDTILSTAHTRDLPGHEARPRREIPDYERSRYQHEKVLEYNNMTAMYFERPFTMRIREGLVELLYVSGDEPMYSVNLKKAIASRLQVYVAGNKPSASIDVNFDPTGNADNVMKLFTIVDEDITGRCETEYQSTPIPDAMVVSTWGESPMPTMCIKGSYFQIMRTRNYDSCEVSPVYNVIGPHTWACPPTATSCATVRSSSNMRASFDWIVACGTLDSFIVLKTEHRGSYRSGPYGTLGGHYDVITQVQLRLRSTRLAFLNPTTWNYDMGRLIPSLVYSFTETVVRPPEALLKFPTLKEAEAFRELPPSEVSAIVPKLHDLLYQTVLNMEPDNSENIHLNLKAIRGMSKILASLNYRELKALYEEISFVQNGLNPELVQRKVALLIDVLMVTGSNPAVLLLKELIISKEITSQKAAEIVSSFPAFIKTPTPEIFHELLTLLRSNVVTQNRPLLRTAMVSVAKLIYLACVNTTEAAVRFPVSAYGHFCTANDSFIVNRFIPMVNNYLNQRSNTVDKLVAITVLGELGHDATLPFLLPVVEGQIDPSVVVRTKGVFALTKLAERNAKVIGILGLLSFNKNECSEIRIAAVTVYLLANPETYRWQHVAAATLWDPNLQFVAYVYTLFESLSKVFVVDNDRLNDMAEKARLQILVAKKLPRNVLYSQNWISHLENEDLDWDAFFQSSFVFGEETLAPKFWTTLSSLRSGTLRLKTHEAEIFAEDFTSLWNWLQHQLFTPSGTSYPKPGSKTPPPSFEHHHEELKRSVANLNLYSTDLKPAVVFVRLTLWNSMTRFYSFNQDDLQQFEKVLGKQWAWRKWLSLANSELLVANSLGQLISAHLHVEGFLHLSGQLVSNKPAAAARVPTDRWKAGGGGGFSGQLDANPLLSLQVTSEVSVMDKLTFSEEVYGVDSHLTCHSPHQLALTLDMSKPRLELTFTPLIKRNMTLWLSLVRPYTCLKSLGDMTPANLSPEARNISVSDADLQKTYWDVEHEYLGWGLRCACHTEGPEILPVPSNLWAFLRGRSYSDVADLITTGFTTPFHPRGMQITGRKLQDRVPATWRLTYDGAEKKLQLRSVGADMNYEVLQIIWGTELEADSQMTTNVKVDLWPGQGLQPLQLCWNHHMYFPALPFHDRLAALNMLFATNFTFNLQFGQTCQDYVVNFTGIMRQSPDFKNSIRDSLDYQVCLRDESEGRKLSITCRYLQEISHLFDIYELKIQYERLPAYVFGMGRRVLDNLGIQWDMAPSKGTTAGENMFFSLVLALKHDFTRYELNISDPTTTTYRMSFGNPLHIQKYFVPWSAKRSLLAGIAEYATQRKLNGICVVEKGSVTTFDETTYSASLTTCDHVVAAIKGHHPLVVLARDENGTVEVTVLVESWKLELKPRSNLVVVNGEPKTLQRPLSLDPTLTLEGGPNVITLTEQITGLVLAVDGAIVILKVPFRHRGQTLGLCGDFNDDALSDLRDGNGCMIGSGDGMIAAYLWVHPTQVCREIPDAVRSELRRDQAACIKFERTASKFSPKLTTGTGRETMTCTRMKNVMVFQNEKKCFSTHPVPQCNPGCVAQENVAKNVGFFCATGRLADHLETESKFKPLSVLKSKPEEFRTTIYVPTSCIETLA